IGLRDRRVDGTGGRGTAAEHQHQNQQGWHMRSNHLFLKYVSNRTNVLKQTFQIKVAGDSVCWNATRSPVIPPDHEPDSNWNGYTAGNSRIPVSSSSARRVSSTSAGSPRSLGASRSR